MKLYQVDESIVKGGQGRSSENLCWDTTAIAVGIVAMTITLTLGGLLT